MTAPRIISNDNYQNIDNYSPDPISTSNIGNTINSTILPGSEELSTINWLGSSYTGADIKVVAHLYKTPQESKEEEALALSIQEIQDIVVGLEQFLAGFDPFFALTQTYDRSDGGQQYILNLAGTSIGTPVARILLPRWYSIAKTERNLQRFKQDIQVFLEQEHQTLTSLQDKQSRIITIRQKSNSTVVLANLQTLSVQTFREKEAVRALGCSYVKSYVRGSRTIGGSMIFTLFNEHALAQLIRSMSGNGSIYGELDNNLSTYIADQLPPIDLTIAFANEYGSISQMSIYGVEFITDGMTMSVEDLLTESVAQFVARDIDVMTSKGNIRLNGQHKGMNFRPDGTMADATASDVIFTSKEAYADYLQRLGIRRRRTGI